MELKDIIAEKTQEILRTQATIKEESGEESMEARA